VGGEGIVMGEEEEQEEEEEEEEEVIPPSRQVVVISVLYMWDDKEKDIAFIKIHIICPKKDNY